VPNVSEGPSSISWAPDGNSFAYDSGKRVFVYEVESRSSRLVADGSAPAFSPDGRWLAYRSTTGQAVALSQRSGESIVLLGGKKILWGVHWSPDSQYVMAAEDRTVAYDVLHGGLFDDRTRKMVIYRLGDGTAVSGNWFAGPGLGDYGYFWVKNYRAVLNSAAVPPAFHSCR
jgi:Tol biopolymer transport system component